jgi:hypothetical protein
MSGSIPILMTIQSTALVRGGIQDYAEETPDNPNDRQKYSQRVLLIVRHAANVLTPLVALQRQFAEIDRLWSLRFALFI